jgi:uncharacterized RDD family membrane protein YckC
MEFLQAEINNEKVYAGFWRRCGAALFDYLLFLPVVVISSYVSSISISIAMASAVFSSLVFYLYVLYFHYKFGATIGKAAVGIRLTLPDGRRIGLKQAMVRSSVDITLGLCMVVAVVIAISKAVPDIYLSAGWQARGNYLNTLYPAWFETLSTVSGVWFYSELLVVLLNKRKRAMHDFMAGTVVVKQEYAVDAVRYATLPSTLRLFFSYLKR